MSKENECYHNNKYLGYIGYLFRFFFMTINTGTSSSDYVFNQANNLEKQSRGERKTMKALENFGFKITNKVTKVKIEKKKQIWIIDNPEVYQSQNYNSLLIFGDAKIGKVYSM